MTYHRRRSDAGSFDRRRLRKVDSPAGIIPASYHEAGCGAKSSGLPLILRHEKSGFLPCLWQVLLFSRRKQFNGHSRERCLTLRRHGPSF